MTKLNADGNILGRLCAVALLVAAGYGLHRLNCSGGMCPMKKADCCAHSASQAEAAQAAPAAAPAPAAR